jgi:hypothetical protein
MSCIRRGYSQRRVIIVMKLQGIRSDRDREILAKE